MVADLLRVRGRQADWVDSGSAGTSCAKSGTAALSRPVSKTAWLESTLTECLGQLAADRHFCACTRLAPSESSRPVWGSIWAGRAPSVAPTAATATFLQESCCGCSGVPDCPPECSFQLEEIRKNEFSENCPIQSPMGNFPRGSGRNWKNFGGAGAGDVGHDASCSECKGGPRCRTPCGGCAAAASESSAACTRRTCGPGSPASP